MMGVMSKDSMGLPKKIHPHYCNKCAEFKVMEVDFMYLHFTTLRLNLHIFFTTNEFSITYVRIADTQITCSPP